MALGHFHCILLVKWSKTKSPPDEEGEDIGFTYR